ncbi:MAG: class I SAM-dependent methyltransferase [Myxococcaceae bacterium]|nr:class I SAM-dependent methyltransferase [Myxococcaceae bacterium]
MSTRSESALTPPKPANYGIDAPEVVRRFFTIAAVGLALGFLAPLVLGENQPSLARSVSRTGFITSFWCLLPGLAMIFGSKVVKLSLREKLLDGLRLKGSERVLDVGCGRGLLLNAAARRLPNGQAVGIDLWQTQDQSGNALERTLENAKAEGVSERIDIKTGDMRKLPFGAEEFDAVVSSWAIHNIYNAEGRDQALAEIARVLKPNGQVLIVDIQHAAAYAQTLKTLGFVDVRLSGPNFLFVIPSRTVTARKPS